MSAMTESYRRIGSGKVCFDARPHLCPLPRGEDFTNHNFWLAADGQLKLKEANGKEIKFEEVVEQAKQAAVLVLVY